MLEPMSWADRPRVRRGSGGSNEQAQSGQRGHVRSGEAGGEAARVVERDVLLGGAAYCVVVLRDCQCLLELRQIELCRAAAERAKLAKRLEGGRAAAHHTLPCRARREVARPELVRPVGIREEVVRLQWPRDSGFGPLGCHVLGRRRVERVDAAWMRNGTGGDFGRSRGEQRRQQPKAYPSGRGSKRWSLLMLC